MMKDWHPDLCESILPPCSLSAACLQRIDEIDALNTTSSRGTLEDVGQLLDSATIKRLADHLSACQTCLAATDTARKRRDQQRLALRTFLLDGETAVPPTIASILTALQQEPPPASELLPPQVLSARSQKTGRMKLRSQRMLKKRISHKAGFALALAVAAVLILVSAQMFSSLSQQTATQTASRAYTPLTKKSQMSSVSSPTGQTFVTHFRTSPTWSSLIVTHFSADSAQLVVENYDPVNKKSVPLFTAPRDTSVDGISHKGDNLVYHNYNRDTQQTTYTFLSGNQYYFAGQGRNAVWSTDDSSVFLTTDDHSIWKVDARKSHTTPIRLPMSVKADSIAFYRNHFLYYIRAQTLYRIDVDGSSSQASEQAIISQRNAHAFWLDLSSEDIYYTLSDTSFRDLYKHASTQAPTENFLAQPNGVPVGYRKDEQNNWSMLYLSWNADAKSFNLMRTNSSTPVLSSLLGGQVEALCYEQMSVGSICDNSVAVSPTGRTMVLGGTNEHQPYQLWFIDIDTQAYAALPLPGGKGPIQLIGWSKLLTE